MEHVDRRFERLRIVILCLLPFIILAGCGPRHNASKQVKKVTITVSPWPAGASVYVAREKGYFEDEGLDATLHTNTSGHFGLADVLAGKADFTACGETPVVRAALAGKPLAVIATICEIDHAIQIIARKDRGISKVRDLRGKRIGVTRGTTGEFFLHIYLVTSYVDPKDVRVINITPDEIVAALLDGKVDAVSTWSPYTTTLRDRLGGNAVTLDEPGLYTMTWNVVVTKDLTRRDPDVIIRFLRAVLRANRFIVEHPAAARAITAKNIGMEIAALEKVWADYHVTAALDESLILYLEDQARWMIKEDRGAGKMPNFLDFVCTDGLKAVRPEAVTMTAR